MKTTIVSGLAALALGCGGSSSSPAPKDHLVVDVDATTTLEQTADGAVASYGYAPDGAPLAPDDAHAFGRVDDAYAVPDVCGSTCTCAAGTFCFGGGAGVPAFSGTCDHATGYEVGCNPVPGGCTDCGCLLTQLTHALPSGCTPRCIPGNGMTVLCD
jgi:hypothetical protein